jgi:hypothetical protein
MILLEIIHVGFNVTYQLLVIFSAITNHETVHQLFIDFKTAYDSVRKEVLYNILT